MINVADVVRELEERMRNERFYPPDWRGLVGSDTELLVRVLVEHINRALEKKLGKTDPRP